MSFARSVQPEWLDELAPLDPRVMRSRQDLRRINAVMRNARIAARALTSAWPQPPCSIVELGAGDGAWLAQLASELPPSWTGIRAVLLDRHDAVVGSALGRLSACGWTPEAVKSDVFAWLGALHAPWDVMVANLFLHHFERDALARLLTLVAGRTRVFVACEPRRCGRALYASRLLGLLGCNAVTRHDAAISVRAGFAGRELSALWPRAGWRIEERACGWFGHLFVAVRAEAAA